MLPNVAEAVGLEDARGHFLLDARYRQLLAGADPNSYGTYGTYLVFDQFFDVAARSRTTRRVSSVKVHPDDELPAHQLVRGHLELS